MHTSSLTTVVAAAALCLPLSNNAFAQRVVETPMHIGATDATGLPAADADERVPSARFLPDGFPQDVWVGLDAVDVERLLVEDELAPAGRPLRIGVPIAVGPIGGDGVSPAGQPGGWIAVDGGKLWMATFEAPGAQGLKLELTDLDLPAGAELWVRCDGPNASSQGPIQGGARSAQSLWTQDLFADTVTVEYWLPDTAAQREGSFRIPRAQYLYRGVSFLVGAGTDGGCHEDAICYPAWHPLHQATVRITFVDGGTFLCSATLLATEAADETPYLLTANHCIPNNTVAGTLTANFFYQTTSCNGSDATAPQAGSATLLATTGTADISLVMLQGRVPAGVTWSGWSTSSFSNGTDLVGIHHPGGQRKKISFGDRITYPFGGSGSTFYWGVSWTLGTIQGGSSGSGLYRASNQLLVGVCSHSAEPLGCANPDGPSGYGKFGWFYDNVSGVDTLLMVGSDDAFEPNDTCLQATSISNGAHADLTLKSTSEDWYSFDLANCERLTVSIDHVNTWGDVDLQIVDGCAGAVVASSLGSQNQKSLSWNNETGANHQVFVRVFLGTGDSDTRNEYDLTIARVAVTNCSSEPFPSFCNGSDNAIIWCPCGNNGDSDTGCDNAAGTGGVRTDVTAFNGPGSSATITCVGYPPAAAPTAILIRSPSKQPGVPPFFGDGVRCISTTNLVRLAAVTASGGTSVHAFNHGALAGPGTFYYQAWYRSTGSFCTAAEFNASSGREITWP